MAAATRAEPLAHVVAGPLGSGKTTVIARLLAEKPPDENWVALLNEFTAAGIDALTVAASARGRYDVRLVEGGCLCCTGEQDFRRNLRELVERVRPQRILVEPSGLGHPAGVVEELLAHERAGRLRLEGVITLIDPPRLAEACSGAAGLLADQIGIADGLALSKLDTSTPEERRRFEQWAATLFPAKRWVGAIERGRLPEAAWAAAASNATQAAAVHEASAHDAAHSGAHTHALAERGASWAFDRADDFDPAMLAELAQGALENLPDGSRWRRFKGVFRVAEDRWLLVDRAEGRPGNLRESSWRRDSRAEIVLAGTGEPDAAAWARWWQQLRAPR